MTMPSLRPHCCPHVLLLCWLGLALLLYGTRAEVNLQDQTRQSFYEDLDWIASPKAEKKRMLELNQKSPPKINWENDFCTDVVRSTCPEIGLSVAVVLGSAALTWALTIVRGRAIGVLIEKPRQKELRG